VRILQLIWSDDWSRPVEGQRNENSLTVRLPIFSLWSNTNKPFSHNSQHLFAISMTIQTKPTELRVVCISLLERGRDRIKKKRSCKPSLFHSKAIKAALLIASTRLLIDVQKAINFKQVSSESIKLTSESDRSLISADRFRMANQSI
jgi:hypothetical protein